MAKTDARITVNLPAEVYEPLKRTCDALGVSMSAMIRDFVETAMPMMAVLEDAGLAIQNAPAKRRAMFADMANELEGVQTEADDLMAKIVQLAHPRASNTGVTK